jgi:23S rRNA (guanine1835-N2)-methyltransferase
MEYSYREKVYHIERYPETGNKSLKALSAADRHVLRFLEEEDIDISKGDLAIVNDRFGLWSCALLDYEPQVIINQYSQKTAIEKNVDQNDLTADFTYHDPLDNWGRNTKLALIRIPKSLELFRLYIARIHECSSGSVTVIVSLMTKHFSPQMLDIAQEFFEDVQQTRAWKKSRLIVIKNKKIINPINLINEIPFGENKTIQQYFGVFSATHIDYGTQFLIEHLQFNDDDNTILDLASGNGILAKVARDKKPDSAIHLLDDSFLAIASSRLNIPDENTFHWHRDNLGHFEDGFFDSVISNPPFHIEHEIDISLPIRLFNEVNRCLKTGGNFQLVANQHLNYKTHLDKIFKKVEIVAENEKFVIYNCIA